MHIKKYTVYILDKWIAWGITFFGHSTININILVFKTLMIIYLLILLQTKLFLLF